MATRARKSPAPARGPAKTRAARRPASSPGRTKRRSPAKKAALAPAGGPAILGLDHLFLATGRFDDAWRFWTETMGLPVASTWGDPGHRGGALAFGEGRIVVAAEDEGAYGDLGYQVRHGVPQLFVRARGLDEVCETLRARGAAILREPHQTHWGPRAFSVQGPDGVVVVFVESPPVAGPPETKGPRR